MVTDDDFADYLAAVIGLDVKTNLIEQVDDVVMIRLYGGQADQELLALRNPNLQIFIRDRDYANAKQLMLTIDGALRGTRAQIGGIACTILPKTGPDPLGMDKKQRHVFSINYELIYQT